MDEKNGEVLRECQLYQRSTAVWGSALPLYAERHSRECARHIIPGGGLGTLPLGIFRTCWAALWAPTPHGYRPPLRARPKR
jgi:hypothetical protein